MTIAVYGNGLDTLIKFMNHAGCVIKHDVYLQKISVVHHFLF